MTKYPYDGGENYEDFHERQRTKYAVRDAERRRLAAMVKPLILMFVALNAFLGALMFTYWICTK